MSYYVVRLRANVWLFDGYGQKFITIFIKIDIGTYWLVGWNGQTKLTVTKNIFPNLIPMHHVWREEWEGEREMPNGKRTINFYPKLNLSEKLKSCKYVISSVFTSSHNNYLARANLLLLLLFLLLLLHKRKCWPNGIEKYAENWSIKYVQLSKYFSFLSMPTIYHHMMMVGNSSMSRLQFEYYGHINGLPV